MDIQFNIDYATVYGEELVLNLLHDGGETTQLHMSCDDGRHWSYAMQNAECRMRSIANSSISQCHKEIGAKTENAGCRMDYYYSVMRGENVLRHEWTVMPHRVELSNKKAERYLLFDRWVEMPEDSYQYSSAFTDGIARSEITPLTSLHNLGNLAEHSPFKTLRLVVRAPQLRIDEKLYLTGEGSVLGNWNIDKALPMTQHNYREWTIDIDTESLHGSVLELKFIAKGRYGASWETGLNRQVVVPQMFRGDVCVVELDQAFFPIANTRVAGTLVPLFSLRSEHSFGVGDFGDLKRMIDWAVQTNQRVLQVLPINDTTTTHTWTDSYPYSGISIFALHPMFANLEALPQLKDEKLRKEFDAYRKQLNALPAVDYEAVNDAKNRYLRLLYAQEGESALKTDVFKVFFKENEYWLVPYSYYSYLREQYGTANFSEWPDHKQWNEADRAVLTNPRRKVYKEVAFYYYVQFVLSQQMEEAHNHARSKGVVLKGDIPIGVNRHGCDVWQEPQLFNLNGQAGAPPDDFSVLGQNWGFPTYNWDAMLQDGCKWWVRRFQNMSHYFDAYRIDHVLGFFRIWEIPLEQVDGLLGQFSPSLAMSRDEIEGYGLHFDEAFYTSPFIADWTINRMFGARAQEIKDKYLQHSHADIWSLRPEYNTQRKVEAAFEGVTDREELNVRDGLYAMVACVLFVRDSKNPNMFHPRITAQLTFAYETLCQQDKETFNRLYNDYFYRRNNQFWYGEAMKKLPILVQATRMLVCAEDLGMVPDCVQWVMNKLRILSLELQSMPKDPSVRFGVLEQFPYRSVCTISSHDMPTLRQWWDEDKERTQAYFNHSLGMHGAAPHPLPGWLARDILARTLSSPSMLCILALQDWLSIDETRRLPDADAERVNIPANPKHYWRYRMHMTIEELQKASDLNENIQQLIQKAGR